MIGDKIGKIVWDYFIFPAIIIFLGFMLFKILEYIELKRELK